MVIIHTNHHKWNFKKNTTWDSSTSGSMKAWWIPIHIIFLLISSAVISYTGNILFNKEAYMTTQQPLVQRRHYMSAHYTYEATVDIWKKLGKRLERKDMAYAIFYMQKRKSKKHVSALLRGCVYFNNELHLLT